MGTVEDLWGIEHDWLGHDADGHVALFSTAGSGWAPEVYARDPDVHFEAIATLVHGPERCPVALTPDFAPDHAGLWRDAGARGLFVFDGDFNRAEYRLIVRPLRPILVDELPPAVAAVVRAVPLAHLHFADLDVIGNDWFEP